MTLWLLKLTQLSSDGSFFVTRLKRVTSFLALSRWARATSWISRVCLIWRMAEAMVVRFGGFQVEKIWWYHYNHLGRKTAQDHPRFAHPPSPRWSTTAIRSQLTQVNSQKAMLVLWDQDIFSYNKPTKLSKTELNLRTTIIFLVGTYWQAWSWTAKSCGAANLFAQNERPLSIPEMVSWTRLPYATTIPMSAELSSSRSFQNPFALETARADWAGGKGDGRSLGRLSLNQNQGWIGWIHWSAWGLQ